MWLMIHRFIMMRYIELTFWSLVLHRKQGQSCLLDVNQNTVYKKNFKNKSASQAVSNPEALGKGFDYNSAKSPHSSVFFLGHQKSK